MIFWLSLVLLVAEVALVGRLYRHWSLAQPRLDILVEGDLARAPAGLVASLDGAPPREIAVTRSADSWFGTVRDLPHSTRSIVFQSTDGGPGPLFLRATTLAAPSHHEAPYVSLNTASISRGIAGNGVMVTLTPPSLDSVFGDTKLSMRFRLAVALAAALALVLGIGGGWLIRGWVRRRRARRRPIWPYALALALAAVQFALMARLVDGDFLNSYPYLSHDGLDYVVEGHYIQTFLTRGSVDLGTTINAQALFPRTPAMLHVLRNPGFVAVTSVDALLGSSGYVILIFLAGTTLITAVYLIRTLELCRVPATGLGMAVIVAVLSPFNYCRVMILSDPLAVMMMQIALYHFILWRARRPSGPAIVPATWAAITAGLVQTYGLIPLLANGLVSLVKNLRLRERTGFHKRLAKAIKEQRWPIFGLLVFLAATIAWKQIPHLSTPPQFENMAFSTAMTPFYQVVWSVVLLPFLPAIAVGAYLSARDGQRWSEAIILCGTIVGVFMVLTYFYQIKDTRFTFAFVPTLVVGIFALLHGQRRANSRASRRVRGATTAFAAAAVLVQTFLLSPYPSSYLDPTPGPIRWQPEKNWIALSLAQSPVDRMTLRDRCGNPFTVCSEARIPTTIGDYGKSMVTDYVRLHNQ